MKGTERRERRMGGWEEEILISPERERTAQSAKPRTQLITYVRQTDGQTEGGSDGGTDGMGNPFYPKGKSLMMAAGIDEGK